MNLVQRLWSPRARSLLPLDSPRETAGAGIRAGSEIQRRKAPRTAEMREEVYPDQAEPERKVEREGVMRCPEKVNPNVKLSGTALMRCPEQLAPKVEREVPNEMPRATLPSLHHPSPSFTILTQLTQPYVERELTTARNI